MKLSHCCNSLREWRICQNYGVKKRKNSIPDLLQLLHLILLIAFLYRHLLLIDMHPRPLSSLELEVDQKFEEQLVKHSVVVHDDYYYLNLLVVE